MRRIAVRGEDCDGVAEVLQADGGVDDEAFCTADAEVGVEEYHVLFLLAHRIFCWWCWAKAGVHAPSTVMKLYFRRG